jgi:hypothetical protein
MFNTWTDNGLSGLGAYVHGGDKIYWAATVEAGSGSVYIPGIVKIPTGGDWSGKANCLLAGIRSNGFSIEKQELVPSSNSFAVNVAAPGDFADLNDVKALFDGIAQSCGFVLRNSHIEPRALNLASPGGPKGLDPNMGKDALDITFDWWGQLSTEVAQKLGLATKVNIPGLPEMPLLTVLAIAAGGILLLGVMRR